MPLDRRARGAETIAASLLWDGSRAKLSPEASLVEMVVSIGFIDFAQSSFLGTIGQGIAGQLFS